MIEKNKIFYKSVDIAKKSKSFNKIILKKRCNSTKLKIKRNVISSFSLTQKKNWLNIEDKYKQTKNNLDFKKYIEANGIDENLNYQYLKELKENKDDDFPKEFVQYKYTLSFSKRIELSTSPKDEINIPLQAPHLSLLLIRPGREQEVHPRRDRWLWVQGSLQPP